MFQGATADRGGERPAWVICSDLGSRAYLYRFKEEAGRTTPVFCANLDKAMRFDSIGALSEAFSILPSFLEAYEEDPRFIDRHIL